MKVAIASTTGTDISLHFGHCASFLVYDIDNDGIHGREERPMNGRGGPDQAAADDDAHDLTAVIQAVHDCVAVLCGGIGPRAAAELMDLGIQPLILADPNLTPEAAIDQLLEGNLMIVQSHHHGGCCCGHDDGGGCHDEGGGCHEDHGGCHPGGGCCD